MLETFNESHSMMKINPAKTKRVNDDDDHQPEPTTRAQIIFNAIFVYMSGTLSLEKYAFKDIESWLLKYISVTIMP